MTGQVIASQFRIERLLGEGGMGAVYLAKQLEMNRHVVVKVAHPACVGQPMFEERFKREAQVVAQLNHPNIVQVHAFGRTEKGQLFLAMEFVPGQTLTRLLAAEGRLTEARALRIMDQVCDALVEAHSLGLVHRDLKPENIMLTGRHGTSDYVKVLDFGIAKIMGDTGQRLTKTGAIFGTPQYMSPEQARGVAVDHRTDIYSLGIILYELLAGILPFSAATTVEYLLCQINELPQSPTRKIADLDILPRTEAVVMRCLAKAPEDRFQSVAELQRELRLCLRDRPAAGPLPTPEPQTPAVAPTGPVRRPKPPKTPKPRPTPTRIALGALAAAVVLLLAVLALRDGPLPDVSNILPMGKDGRPVGDYLFGIPVPKGSELQSRIDEMLTVRTPCSPEEVVAFYRRHLRKAWGPVKDIANGLQFGRKDAPYTAVSVVRIGNYTTVILAPNALGKPAMRREERIVHGITVPAEARKVSEINLPDYYTLSFQVPRPVSEVIAQYQNAYPDKGKVDMFDGVYQGRRSFAITAKDKALPWKQINIMETTDADRAGPGTWTMVALNDRRL
jgi:tRNA A-37 threonylcarbamoyl transferase component Bud32